MNGRRFVTVLGVVAVASVAGAISYHHQQHLAAIHGQPDGLSLIWPLCVDGLVTVTAVANSTDRAAGFRPRPWALVGFWIGVAVSLATNWLATDGGLINHGVSAFPALAFLLAIESLSSKPRVRKLKRTAPVTEPVSVADDVTDTAIVAPSPVAKPVRVTGEAKSATARRSQSAAANVAATARRLPGATPAVIAAKAGVSESTARRHLAAMVAAPDGASEPVNGHDVLAGVAA